MGYLTVSTAIDFPVILDGQFTSDLTFCNSYSIDTDRYE